MNNSFELAVLQKKKTYHHYDKNRGNKGPNKTILDWNPAAENKKNVVQFSGSVAALESL